MWGYFGKFGTNEMGKLGKVEVIKERAETLNRTDYLILSEQECEI